MIIPVVRVLGFVQADTLDGREADESPLVVCLHLERHWQKTGMGLLPAAKGLYLGRLGDQMEWARVKAALLDCRNEEEDWFISLRNPSAWKERRGRRGADCIGG